MKKLMSLLLCLSMALSLCACGGGEQKKAEDSSDASIQVSNDLGDEIQVPKGYELKVAFPENNAPFSYVDESGNLVGMDVDLANAVCAKNEWTLSAKAIDWSTRDQVLSSGEVDCVWGSVNYNQSSADDALWAVYGGIYVDATVLDESEFNKLSDLKGKTIEVEPVAKFALEGDTATELGKQLAADAGKLVDAADAQSAYNDLAQGKCDAIVVSGTSDDTVNFDDFESAFKALYDVDVYSEDDGDGSNADFEMVTANGLCELELGAGFAEDSDIYYAVGAALEEISIKGELATITETWSQKDNGAYADAIRRCTFYMTQEEGLDGDSSVIWDVDPFLDDSMGDEVEADGDGSAVVIDLGEAEDGSVITVN